MPKSTNDSLTSRHLVTWSSKPVSFGPSPVTKAYFPKASWHVNWIDSGRGSTWNLARVVPVPTSRTVRMRFPAVSFGRRSLFPQYLAVPNRVLIVRMTHKTPSTSCWRSFLHKITIPVAPVVQSKRASKQRWGHCRALEDGEEMDGYQWRRHQPSNKYMGWLEQHLFFFIIWRFLNLSIPYPANWQNAQE